MEEDLKILEPIRWWRAGDAILLFEEAAACIRASDNPTGCVLAIVDKEGPDGDVASYFMVANESGRVLMDRNLGGLCPPVCPEALKAMLRTLGLS